MNCNQEYEYNVSQDIAIKYNELSVNWFLPKVHFLDIYYRIVTVSQFAPGKQVPPPLRAAEIHSTPNPPHEQPVNPGWKAVPEKLVVE